MNPDSSGIFSNFESITSIDLSHFDTSKVINMRWLVFYCRALTSLNLSSFNTSNVTDMLCMFGSCTSLTSLDISGFDTSKVTDMSAMFQSCSALTNIIYGPKFINISINNLTHTDNSNKTTAMFSSCPANKPTWANGTWKNGTFIKL